MPRKRETKISNNKRIQAMNNKEIDVAFHNCDIHKCARCGMYHDGEHQKQRLNKFATNMTLCVECESAEKYYKEWQNEDDKT